MKILELDKTNFDNEILYTDFFRNCSKLLDILTDMSPSDNDVHLTVCKYGSDFVAQIKINSVAMAVSLSEVAKSPFVAVDRAFEAARHKVRVWSSSRL